MDYGKNIKQARLKAGLTQAQLAEKCGLASITIRQYEASKRSPSLEKLAIIARALGTSAFELMGSDFSEVSFDDCAWPDVNSGYETTLLNEFRRLNYDGQLEAIKRIRELAALPEYTENGKG